MGVERNGRGERCVWDGWVGDMQCCTYTEYARVMFRRLGIDLRVCMRWESSRRSVCVDSCRYKSRTVVRRVCDGLSRRDSSSCGFSPP